MSDYLRELLFLIAVIFSMVVMVLSMQVVIIYTLDAIVK